MNLDPFTVMQNMAFIKGKTAWSGSFCRTLIERTGKFKDLELNYIGEKGKDSYGCYLSATRISDGKKIDGPQVTIAMAKAEKWTSNPKWNTLPDLMLAYRCQSYFCRIHCPEAMTGIYTAEEVEDINTPKQSAPVDILQEVSMGNYARKLERNQLKKQLNTNKIQEFWHSQKDPLWKRMQDGMRNARKEK